MLNGILRSLVASILLSLPLSAVHADAEHFWLLHESGIEKRSMEDGSQLGQVVQLYKPLTFSVDESNNKIWAVADGYISSYDLDGSILASSELENINQGARLIANSEDGGAWLSHKGDIYRYNQDAQRLSTIELKLPGNQINDIALDPIDSSLWFTSGNQVISITNDGDVVQHALDKEETATGITVTEEQEIAVAIATPKPEFRIYNKDFELQTTIPLPQQAANPVRISRSGESSFWIAAKQSVVLVDSNSGEVASHPLTGELGLGPGEIDVIGNERDGSAWISIGKTLAHIEADGNEMYESEGLYKLVELESDSTHTSIPVISFPYYPLLNSWSTIIRDPFPYKYNRIIILEAKSHNSEIEHSSLKLNINGVELTTSYKANDFFHMRNPYNNTTTCTSGLNIYFGGESYWSSNQDWIYCKISQEFIKRLDDTYLVTASISDTNGNTSNTASLHLKLDTTKPPSVNKDLIEVSENQNGILTIKGLPGAIPSAGDPFNSWFTIIEDLSRIHDGGQISIGGNRETKYSLDGSFEVSINGSLGDTIRFRNFDYAHNISTSYLATSAYIPISITLPINNELLTDNKTTVTGTHGGDTSSTITVNGVTATVTENTFIAHDVPINDTGLITAEILASNGAKGTITIKVSVGYPIDIIANQPTAGGSVYSQKVLVSGTHNGPEGTAITINGGAATVSGTQFSKETEVDPYTGAIEIIATGPNGGYGETSFNVVYKVPAPDANLIDYYFNSNGTITLTGEPGAAIANGTITVYNTTLGTMTEGDVAQDGSFTVTISAVGGDTLTLVATDKNGIEASPTTSDAGYEADINITSPLKGAEVGTSITVTGTHAGPAESVITVNGIAAVITGTTFTADNIPVGSGTISAKLFSTDGAYGIDSINVVPDITPPDAPDLDFIDTVFIAAQHVRITGQPGAVEGGSTLTITNTKQSESKTLTVAEDGSFTTHVPGLPGESLSLTATDAVGNQGEAATLVLGSEVVISIDSPYAGALIPALTTSNGNLTGLVNVTGHHNGPVNSGIVVNGVVAAVSADQFVALNVPVAADGIISAKLTTLDGSHGMAQLTVGLNEQPYRLSLTPSSTEGMVPHSVNFKWNAYTAETPTEVSIDYDGDGIFDQSSTDLTTPLQRDYAATGINKVTLRITMADGSYHTAETVVVTHGSDYYDAIFLSLWEGMNEALLVGDPMVALNYLNTNAQSRFYVTFNVIAPNMQAVMNSYQPHAMGEVTDSYLETFVPRNIDGRNKIFVIYSLKGMDGIWRIDSM